MIKKRGYQLHFSRGRDGLKDVAGRFQKSKKILGVFRDACPDTQSLNCLDIGCSTGMITSFLGDHFSRVLGMDIDQEAIAYAHAHPVSPRVQFLTGDSLALPFRDNTIDLVVCNHVYEHVPDPKQMMEEIYRVLRGNGLCYFAASNKYMVMEDDYGLPFLSWLPKPLAHRYLKLARRGDFYYEENLSLRGLKKLVSKFEIHDYTLSIILDPEKYSANDLIHTGAWWYRLIRWMAPYLYPLIPTYIWVLTKK